MKQYTKRNRSTLCGALICVLISAACAVTLQFFKGNVLDMAIAGDARATMKYALLLIGFILGEIGFYFVYDRLSARFVAGCMKDLKVDLFCSILHRSYVGYRALPRGEYIAKYTNETDLIRERQFSMLPLLGEIVFKVLFVGMALFLLDWRIALITIFLLTTPLYVPKLIEKRLHKAQADYVAAVEENLSKVSDWLLGFEVIKNFSVEQHIMERFHEANGNVAQKWIVDADIGILSRLISTLISYLSYFIILAFAAYLVIAGDFSAGDFFVAIGMIDQLSYPLISLSGIIRRLVAVRPTCRSMEAFIGDIAHEGRADVAPNMAREIRFDDVAFAYDGARPLFEKFSLVMEKGKRYLLKGPSGCGKTTVVNLLLRYYDATGGSITLDGVPTERFGNAYSLITVVRQDATLFHDTLRNNLTMYREVDDARLLSLLEGLGLSKFANAHALDGMLLDGGANLSGGEKRRICLARALLRDTEVLILDEPLANLDEETALAVEELLFGIEGRTLLIVSHQFSKANIGRFDKVVDMAGFGA